MHNALFLRLHDLVDRTQFSDGDANMSNISSRTIAHCLSHLLDLGMKIRAGNMKDGDYVANSALTRPFV